MVMYIKDNGKMIKHMEKVSIIIMMVPVIQVNGLKMYNKGMELKNGLMGRHIKGNDILLFEFYRYHHSGYKHGHGKFIWADFS